MATIETIQEVTGVKLSLTLEEARSLFELLYRGTGPATLNSLGLAEVLSALQCGVVTENGIGRWWFKEIASLEDKCTLSMD